MNTGLTGWFKAVSAGALLLCALIAADRLRAAASERYRQTETYEARYYLPRAEVLPILSLGYDRAAADLVWMRALVYLGDEFAHEGQVRHSFHYVEAGLALDPDFRAFYEWAGYAGTYTPREVTVADIEQAVAIQRRGLERFPEDGELMYQLGSTIAYDLIPRIRRVGRDDEIPSLQLEASELLAEAAALGAAPDYVVLGNAATLNESGQRAHAIDRLERVYAITDDPQIREEIGKGLAALRDEQRSGLLTEDFERIHAEWQASYPWVPMEFYGLIAP